MKCPHMNGLGYCTIANLQKCVGAEECILINVDLKAKAEKQEKVIDDIKVIVKKSENNEWYDDYPEDMCRIQERINEHMGGM